MDTPTIKTEMIKEIDRVFMKQQQAAPRIARSNLRDRIQKLDLIASYLEDENNFRELCRAMDHDFRKPEVEVVASETGVVLSHIRYIRSHLRRWMHPRRVSTPLSLIGTSSYVHYEPKGVCLVIAPWNYPLNLAIVPLIYAIAAGNTVILKPSEISAHSSAFIKKMIGELFPVEEVAVFEGDATVAEALLARPFNHIFFTGSPGIGKIVMAAAAKNLASVTLELGGKSPALIDSTAELETIAGRTAWSKCFNNGQTCIAPDYLIVHESVAGKFVNAFRAAVERLYGASGSGVQQSQSYGRIISDRHFRRLRNLLDDAVAKGAHIEMGGQIDEDDRFISPTLLTNISEDMEIMHEEIFGPLMPMVTYRDPEEAVAIIRRRPKPLTMYIASRDRKAIDYLIGETSAGGTIINDYMLGYSNPNLPFGGVNNSGIGKSMGFHGFVEFSNERGVIKRKWGTLSFIFPPYTERVKKLVKMIYRWV